MPKENVKPGNFFSCVPHRVFPVGGAGGRKMVFISGQTAWDIRKKIVGGDSLLEQARQALRNVQSAIEVTGGTLKDIVFLRIYIVNYQPENAETVSVALKEFFSTANPPASTWIGVSGL